jgi:hypothetical protein
MDIMHALTSDEDSSKEFPKPRQDYIKFLFKNEMFADYPNLDMMGFPRSKMLVDAGTHYKNNSFGFRGEDWVGVSDILALGCSNTYGVGVPIDGTWPSILSKMSNSSVRSMSFPGASIHQLVSMAFKYFEMFGNPKTILCLFPDPYRIKIPSNPNLAISETKFSGLMHPLFLQSKNDMNERPKYSRRPHKYEDILPQEVALFMSTQHIHMLEQYCRSNNIKLIWSTWLDNFSKTINSIEENIFNSFVYDDEFTIHLEDFESECHTEFKEEFKKYFVRGLDVEDDEYFRHPGVHKHIHIAEAFYSRIKESI